MARPAADRIKAVWTGTGTGTMTLGGAAPGESVQAFPASLDGQVISYLIVHETAQEAEVGHGLYTHSGTTLSRLYRYYPTPGGAAVAFSSGTKFVSPTVVSSYLVPNIATVNPGVNDGINAGFLRGHDWINSSSKAVFKCTDHTAGAAVWEPLGTAPFLIGQYDILGRVASGTGLPTGISPVDLTEELTPAAGDWVPVWLATGEFRKSNIANFPTGTGDVEPSQVTSGSGEYVLTSASRLHTNTEVLSLEANVDFEVPTTATAGSKWLIKFLHDGCTVSVDTNVGSINGTAGGSARGVNGGLAIVEVRSNAGSAPVVLVRGNVLVPPVDVGGTKTYDNDDSGQAFRITAIALQTFGAAAGYTAGFVVSLFKETAGTVTLDGVDNNYNMAPASGVPAVVTIMKVGTALIAFGSDGAVVLDAA